MFWLASIVNFLFATRNEVGKFEIEQGLEVQIQPSPIFGIV